METIWDESCFGGLPIEPSHNDQVEAKVTQRVANEYGGTIEVKCNAGVIDIVTRECVIEVKSYNRWKHALGQVLTYSIDTGLKPAVYLFIDTATSPPEHDLARVRPYFNKLNVILLNDQYKPSTLATLPTEALVHLITIVLTINPGAVQQLALNRRIWGLASTIWPPVVRGQLQAITRTTGTPPVTISTDLTVACLTMSLLLDRPSTTTCSVLLKHKCTDTHNILFAVGFDKGEHMVIVLHRHLIIFNTQGTKYKPRYYRMLKARLPTVGPPSMSLYDIDLQTKTILMHNIRQLMSKILPELLDYFDFEP